MAKEFTQKDARNPNKVVAEACRRGCTVSQGGSHTKLTAPDGRAMAVPRHRELSTGVANKIFKWIVALMVVLFLFAGYCIAVAGLPPGIG